MSPLATPRDVVFAGPGLRPGAVLLALCFFILPSALTPFLILALDATETLGPAIFLPTLFWLGIGALGIWSSVLKPLRRRNLIIHGTFVPGEVTSVTGARPPKKVTVAYTAADGLRRETTLQTSRPAQVGDRVQVAHEPHRPGHATVVELGDWRVREPGSPPSGALTTGRMALLLLSITVAMVGMGLGFGGTELKGERTLVQHPGLFPATLLAAVALAVWSARRQKLPPQAALWNGMLYVAAPMAVLGLGMIIGTVVPPREHPLSVTVEASFCLESSVVGPICLLELRTPPELAPLHLVRTAGRERLHVGQVIPLILVEPLFSPNHVRSTTFRTWDWKPETDVESLFIDKRHSMSSLIRGRSFVARGEFSEQSQTRAELDRLAIDRR